MRLSNDRDQEIIKSAIPNSSISTTSFLSSIGNGEAIAFGEAITVPMRMKFARVEEKYLPKAHGIVDKNSDDSPDNVDLRTVVARMRAVTGPDISSFQQSFTTANIVSDENQDDDFPEASEAELERWSNEIRSTGHVSVSTPPPLAPEPRHAEPYRPDMLPRTPQAEPPTERRYSDLIRREPPPETPPAPRAQAYEPTPRPNSLLRREGSLRESLLKKPLSSLYDKD